MSYTLDALRALLIQDSAVNGIINEQAYLFRAPQGITDYYVVFTSAGAEPWHHVSGQSNKGREDWDIHIYGPDPDTVKSLLHMIRALLNGYRGSVTIQAGPPAVIQFLSSIWVESYSLDGPDPRNGNSQPDITGSLSLRVVGDLATN